MSIVACAGNTGNTPLNSGSGNSPALNNNQAAKTNVAQQAIPDPDAALASARTQYKTMCANCHKDNGEGGKMTTDIGSFNVPSFKRESVIKEPDSEYVDYIKNGEEAMPSFKEQLNDAQINALVKMIRNDFQNIKAPKQPQ